MGSGSSRIAYGSAPGTNPMHSHRRSFSSIFACGCLSSSRRMVGYPTELLTDSAKSGYKKETKFPIEGDNLSLGNEQDLVSTERGLAAENPASRAGVNSVEFGNKGKCSPVVDNCIGIETASTSNTNQPFSCSVSGSADSLLIDQKLNQSSSIHSDCHEEPLFDEISVEKNVSDEVEFSHSDLSSSSSSSDVVGSPYFHMLRNNVLQEATPPRLSFAVLAREDNQRDGGLLQVDVVSLSSNVLPSNSSEIGSREARRNSRILFWDAFSNRNNRSHTDSRTPVLIPDDSGSVRYHDRFLDSCGDEIGGDARSLGSRTPGYNEPQWHSRAEVRERLRGTQDSTDHPTSARPRRMHGDGTCSCCSSFAEGYGTHTGASRIVMLAEALFEVLDQIHQHPMSMFLSVVSLPAPELVVDSFPVKTHSKSEKQESADDIAQCYICLSEYEEGEDIRVLPCEHEYHMSCVDKWLKEIHGVCPLCRRDVRSGSNDSV